MNNSNQFAQGNSIDINTLANVVKALQSNPQQQ